MSFRGSDAAKEFKANHEVKTNHGDTEKEDTEEGDGGDKKGKNSDPGRGGGSLNF